MRCGAHGDRGQRRVRYLWLFNERVVLFSAAQRIIDKGESAFVLSLLHQGWLSTMCAQTTRARRHALGMSQARAGACGGSVQ